MGGTFDKRKGSANQTERAETETETGAGPGGVHPWVMTLGRAVPPPELDELVGKDGFAVRVPSDDVLKGVGIRRGDVIWCRAGRDVGPWTLVAVRVVNPRGEHGVRVREYVRGDEVRGGWEEGETRRWEGCCEAGCTEVEVCGSVVGIERPAQVFRVTRWR